MPRDNEDLSRGPRQRSNRAMGRIEDALIGFGVGVLSSRAAAEVQNERLAAVVDYLNTRPWGWILAALWTAWAWVLSERLRHAGDPRLHRDWARPLLVREVAILVIAGVVVGLGLEQRLGVYFTIINGCTAFVVAAVAHQVINEPTSDARAPLANVRNWLENVSVGSSGNHKHHPLAALLVISAATLLGGVLMSAIAVGVVNTLPDLDEQGRGDTPTTTSRPSAPTAQGAVGGTAATTATTVATAPPAEATDAPATFTG